MIYYLHTIDRKPAYFDGHQIVYATKGRAIKLVSDLKQIKREQRASHLWRQSKGLELFNDYGHMRVSTPEE